MKAWFVKSPRRLDDLIKPHFVKDEQEFTICKRVILDWIDYENFSEDMLVSREYLENARQSASDAVSCILVSCRGRHDGILVQATEHGYVISAAYLA